MNRDSIEEILKNLGSEDVPADVHKIAEETSRDFSKTLMQTRQPKHYVLLVSAERAVAGWEYIMRSKITKLAVAAAIIIVALIGIHQFGRSIESVALADVLAKVEQAQAFMYKMKMTMTGNMMPSMPAGKQEMQGTITISNEYGMKMEMDMTDPNSGKKTTQQMYILPERKAAFMIIPEIKKYMRMEFDDDLLARMKKQNNDPREMIKRFMGCKYTELGRSEIDGVKVEGFQTTDPAAYLGGAIGSPEGINLTLWVDVESWLPVQVDMDVKVNEQMQMQYVIYGFQWDIAVDAGEFEPVIPQDFTAFPTEGMKMPAMSEEAAIEGLRFFAVLSGGRYPQKLNMVNLMQETVKLKDSESPAAEKLRQELEKCGTEEEKATKILEVMRPIQSLGMFYMTLVQDKKEPVYYGESVGPDDGDSILLKWKISDGQYRVIYGDLTAEDVTAEELAGLEKGLKQ